MSQNYSVYPAKTQSKFFDWYEQTNYEHLEWQGWNLPMSGKAKEDCGQWAWRGCLDHKLHSDGKIRAESYQICCFTGQCPKCAGQWAKRSTARVLERLKASKKNQKYLKHVVVSPPKWLHHKPIEDLRKEARKIAKLSGVEGGLDIVHPFRQKNGQWYVSPHFHYLAYGWVESVTKHLEAKGWIVKNIGIRENPIGTIMYLLSHAGVKKGRHTVTWFGDLSYSKLKIEKSESTHKCPECNALFQRLIRFVDGFVAKPPPIRLELIEDPEGWKYWIDHIRGY